MRKIQIPEKWQRSESGITVFLNGKSREKIFVRGGIVFPTLDEKLGYTGSVCIAGMFESDQDIVIFELEHFSCYDSFLAMLFKRFYDRYGVQEYYFNADADGEFEAKKFMMEKETREYSCISKFSIAKADNRFFKAASSASSTFPSVSNTKT